MVAYFFIDRPIFATVMSVVIALAGGIALFFLPVAQYPRITPPGITISITYPGASAQVVADTVAAPIEQQVNGVEGMLYMSSQSGNDGSYSLTVTFDIGTDVNTALVMVQNRVALAMPQLPSEVQNQGITIRKRTPDMLLIVNFISPKQQFNSIYLSNFATIYVRDELLRVDGVSDITYQGQRDYSIRVWLDPRKLAALNLTAMDVANAVAKQNLDGPAGRIGQPPMPSGQSFQLPLDLLGRLSEPEQFGDIIVKVGGQPPVLSPMGVPVQSMTPPTAPSTSVPLTNPTTLLTVRRGSITLGLPPLPNNSATATAAPSSTIGGVQAGGPTGGDASNSGPVIIATPGGSGSGGANAGGGATATGGASATGGATGVTLTSNAIAAAAPTSTVGAGGLTGGTLGSGPPSPASAIVRLRDVARIELGAKNYNMACTFDGMPSVGLMVYQLPGTNALDVAQRVRAKMRELKKSFPEGVDYIIGYDTTPYISESVADVEVTLFEAVGLVALVVLVFLQDWRAMILPLIDVPVSILGTFGVMAMLGFSLNNISLFGLVLAIGIVVDDAIVVLENIERMMAKGMDPRTAARRAMDEVTGPIIAVALVLVAVFLPCAFVSGITGLFFHQFAVTISVSTAISAFNAITMTPSRAVLLFKDKKHGGQAHQREALPWWFFGLLGGAITCVLGRRFLAGHFGLPALGDEDAEDISLFRLWGILGLYSLPGLVVGGILGKLIIRPVNVVLGWTFRTFNQGFDWMVAGYGWVVGKSLKVSVVVLLGYGVLLVLTWYTFKEAPAGFIPSQDQGRLILSIQLPDSASLERTRKAVAEVDEVLRHTPGVHHTVTFSGMSFILQASSPNFASGFVVLDPFDQRQKPELRDTAIMARLRKEWSEKVKDAAVTVLPSSPVPGLGTAGGYKFLVQDRGGMGVRPLQTQTDALARKLKEEPMLSGATSQFRANTPQLYLDVDRTKAVTQDVNILDVTRTLDIYLGSLYVNSYNAFGRQWQVTLQAEQEYRDRVEAIDLFQVRNAQGQMVPLSTLAQPREIGGPIAITRYNLYASAPVNGNIQPGFSTGEAIAAIERDASENLPLSMKAEWTELMFLQIRAGNTGMYVFALGVICVFLALAALYESWSLPLAVILVVPLCLLCSVLGVRWTNRDVNIFVLIGLVVLVGLACKNAILVVEFAKQLHLQGMPVGKATVEASRLRLRPILMTSFAFIFGVVPLMLASGAGAEMRRSLGVAVFSGMLGVTLFGIFLTPVFFYVIQALGDRPIFAAALTRVLGSGLIGGALGCAAGYALAGMHILRMPAGPIAGACVGACLVLAVSELHRQIKPRVAAAGRNVAFRLARRFDR